MNGTSHSTTTDAGSKTLIGAIDQLAHDLGSRFDGIDRLATRIAGILQVPREATSDPREEVLVRYTVGKGSFSADKKYSVLRMKMYKMNGDEDGTHDGVWEPQAPAEQAEALLSQPVPPPQEPFDKAAGPVPPMPPRAFTKAIWTFGDGSSITAVGPAMLSLVPFKENGQIFLVSVAAIITNGTGRYAGARGVKTALGSTFVPPGVDMFALPPEAEFGAVTVETFRVVRKEFIA